MPVTARILIIDDEPRWISFARNDLEAAFEVEIAKDLSEALDKLKQNHFDLVIASSRRVDVLEAINQGYPGERVVVATGHPTTREAIEMYRFDILDYFAKSIQRKVLSEKVREAIKKPVKAPA
jgi:DNA-binding NtrC family response regulator